MEGTLIRWTRLSRGMIAALIWTNGAEEWIDVTSDDAFQRWGIPIPE